MIKNMGMMMTGGNMPESESNKVMDLVRSFETMLETASQNLPPKVARFKLSGSVYIIKDQTKIILVYAPKQGSEVITTSVPNNVTPSNIVRELVLYKDLEDYVVAVLPGFAIEALPEQLNAILLPAVNDVINRSVSEFEMNNSISAFSPIFGANKYPIQDKLVFVLMPFSDPLNEVYKSTIRPAIEDDCRFVCRRADEIKSTNSIMQDIWKSICESRIVVADLTNFNPNVMYELGITHTIGKPTLLLYQDKKTTDKFPFDLAHIRRINYEDSAAGGVRLRSELADTIRAMLAFEA